MQKHSIQKNIKTFLKVPLFKPKWVQKNCYYQKKRAGQNNAKHKLLDLFYSKKFYCCVN